MNQEGCERPKAEEYLTYLGEGGFKTVRIDSHAVHPDKSIIVDIVFGKKPVFRFNLESFGLHEYLDLTRSHVFDCQTECKTVINERRGNEY